MKYFKFTITFLFTLALFVGMHFKFSQVPPPGKFLDPFHGFWQNASNEAIDAPAHLPLANLSAPVRIYYDEHLIPHIFADNQLDLYRAVGYVQAYHRLWQMELQTHDAAGRLSEIVGPATLDRDRLKRRQGMRTSALKTLQKWESIPEIDQVIAAYTEGVNAYIASLAYAQYPIEYKLLDYAPEPWTKLKCVLLLKYMSAMLTLNESDMENTNAFRLLGAEDFNMLFPDMPTGIVPVIAKPDGWEIEPVPVPTPNDSIGHFPTLRQPADKMPRALGSNNWAVAGTKTQSGYPILCNDMHLGLRLPNIWFQIQAHTPDMNVFGHTIPGAPFIITGFNDSIAWGFTNAYRDLVDWYTVEYKDARKNQYRYDGKWMNTRKVIETVKVRGLDDVTDTVVYTHQGPVVYDARFPVNPEKTNLAMRWLAHEESLEPLAFLQMARAQNYGEFQDAIRHFQCPPQNIAFASAAGDVAMHIQGHFPLKWPGQGKFILDGSQEINGWHGFIPPGHNPAEVNPARGFVSSANQHPVDSLYPYYTYADHFEYFRNVRLHRMLDSLELVTPQHMQRLQLDNYSVRAEMILPLLLDSLATSTLSGRASRIADELRGWNYHYAANEAAPAYFELWWKNLYDMLWDEFESDSMALEKPSAYITMQLMHEKPAMKYVDEQNTPEQESLTDLIQNSFYKTLSKIDEWEQERDTLITWSGMRTTDISHMIPFLTPFSYQDLPVGGHASALNAITGSNGPSQRLVVQLGPEVKAYSTYPGGQSGNPGSPHYDHFIDSWVQGRYVELLFLKQEPAGDEGIIFMHTLEPEQ
jgi:penicillin amidase